MSDEIKLPISSHHCNTTHSACDCVLKRLSELEAENEKLKADQKITSEVASRNWEMYLKADTDAIRYGEALENLCECDSVAKHGYKCPAHRELEALEKK